MRKAYLIAVIYKVFHPSLWRWKIEMYERPGMYQARFHAPR